MTRSNSNDNNIYDPKYVKGLFDRMSKTYGVTNYISSFGFTERWRKACIRDLPPIKPDSYGFDFMSGMGESWEHILKRIDHNGKIIAIDISEEMNKKASEHRKRLDVNNIE